MPHFSIRLSVFCAIAFCSVVLISSCSKDQAMQPPPASCDLVDVSFANDILPIMETNCSNPDFGDCHQDGASNPAFTTHAGGFSTIGPDGLGPFEARVLILEDMPPNYSSGPRSLSAFDKKMIECWLMDGAPNN